MDEVNQEDQQRTFARLQPICSLLLGHRAEPQRMTESLLGEIPLIIIYIYLFRGGSRVFPCPPACVNMQHWRASCKGARHQACRDASITLCFRSS